MLLKDINQIVYILGQDYKMLLLNVFLFDFCLNMDTLIDLLHAVEGYWVYDQTVTLSHSTLYYSTSHLKMHCHCYPSSWEIMT